MKDEIFLIQRMKITVTSIKRDKDRGAKIPKLSDVLYRCLLLGKTNRDGPDTGKSGERGDEREKGQES